MGRRDTTAPVANITSPVNGSQTTSSSVSITGTGVDATGVTSMRLLVGTTQVATTTYTAAKNVTRSISATYNFPTYGNYGITCEVKDAAGNAATKTINITYASTTSTTSSTTTLAPPPPLPITKLITCPPIIYQGGEGSCVSCAVANQRAIKKYHDTGDSSYSDSVNIFSVEFLYNQVKVAPSCASGSSPVFNLDFVRLNGICTNATLPLDLYNGCDASIITDPMKAEALNYTIPTYSQILATDHVAIKTQLANNHALLFTCQLDTNFTYAQPGYIWNSRGSLQSVHGMILVGYDDNKQAYRIMNSWGTNWCDAGFIWVDYVFFSQIVGYVYPMY